MCITKRFYTELGQFNDIYNIFIDSDSTLLVPSAIVLVKNSDIQ